MPIPIECDLWRERLGHDSETMGRECGETRLKTGLATAGRRTTARHGDGEGQTSPFRAEVGGGSESLAKALTSRARKRLQEPGISREAKPARMLRRHAAAK
jgi:hypothetical protein